MNFDFLIFRNQSFLYYWLATWCSTLGNAVYTLGMSWLIVKTTGSGMVMGTFLLIMGVVRSGFMLFGGVQVDRVNPMTLMKLSVLARALMMAGLLFTSPTSGFPLWVLYTFAAVFGFVDAYYLPSASAARQRLVEQEFYTQLNSLLLVAGQVSMVIGPVIGSLLTGMGGFKTMFGVIAGAYALALVLLQMVRLKPITDANSAQGTKKNTFAKDLAEGVRYVFKTPIIISMIVIATLVNAGISVMAVTLPFLAQQMNIGVQGLGIMNSGIGLGGALAAVVFSVWVISRPTPQMNLTACLFEGLAVLSICFVNNEWIVAGLLTITGITTTAINVIAPSVNQAIIPKELFGRVISVSMLAMNGSIPISQALSGFLIDRVSAHQVFLYGGLLEAGAAFVGFFLPAIRNFGKSPSETSTVIG